MNERPKPRWRESRRRAADHGCSEHSEHDDNLRLAPRVRLAPGLLVSLLALVLTTPASAFAMSIDDAIRLALKGNERARIAELRIEQASGSVERARGSFLPQLTLGANSQMHGYEDRSGRLWSHSATLTATQPLIAPSAYMQYSQAEHTLKAEQSNAVELQRSLSFDTARAFVLVLANQQVLTAAERRLERAKENLRNSEARASAQLTSTNDATKSKIDVASAAQSVATSTSTLQRAKNQLALLIGAEEVGDLEQPDTLISAATSFQGDTPSLIANAVENRPDIRVLREQVQAAQASAKEPNYRLIPSLSLMGQIRANPVPLPSERWHDEVLQLSLSWTLFDGGARYGDRRTRLAQAESTEMELRLARRGVGTGVKAAMAALIAAREAVSAAEVSVASARQNGEETAILYQQGLAKAIEVTDANARTFDAEVGLASAKLTLAQSYLELRQAMGLFPSDNVGPTVERRGEESGQ